MTSNTSGNGNDSIVPAEVHGWNWGAFFLSWIWGIANNTYRAFWVFVPIVNIFIAISLGLKGNEWAWRNKQWESIEHFRKVQKNWARASLLVIVAIPVFVFTLLFGINSLFKNSDPFKMSMTLVNESSVVTSKLGLPLETGFVTGSMQTSGPTGLANISYTIQGAKGDATVAVKATKKMSEWSIDCLHVIYKDLSEKTVLKPCR